MDLVVYHVLYAEPSCPGCYGCTETLQGIPLASAKKQAEKIIKLHDCVHISFLFAYKIQ